MALIEPRRPRSGPHPIADAMSDDTMGRRLTLREGLGTRSADKRLCEAANRILGGLEHPNVAHALRVERDDQERLVVVYGHDDLESAELHLGTNDATFVAHILHEVCQALDAAHGLGVIHGALTPAAVRIEPRVDTPAVRVCDFGLGHLFGAAATLEGRVEWLPYSPEKQLGLEPTPAEDVYLLGALGFALLTGRPLFEAATHKQVLRMHALESSAERVLGTLGCEPWLAEILARCLETEPEDRYPCPADVADVLRPQLVARPASPTPPRPEITASPAPAGPSLPPFDAGPHAHRCGAVEPSVPTLATPIIETAQGRGWSRQTLLVAAGLALLGLGAWALMPSATETHDARPVESSAASMAAAEHPTETLAPVAAPNDPPQPDPALNPPGPNDAPQDAEDAEDAEGLEPLEDPYFEADVAQAAVDPNRPPVDPADPGLTADQRQAEAEQLCLEALSARRSGRTSDAIRLYKRALAVRANHAPASHALGTIYFNRRDYQSAIRYEKKAAQAAPKRSAYELALGDYYFKSGNGSSARRHWTRASRLGSKLAKKRLTEQQ